VPVRVVEDPALAVDDDRVVDVGGVKRGNPADAPNRRTAAKRNLLEPDAELLR
jgi:hypothetical protein